MRIEDKKSEITKVCPMLIMDKIKDKYKKNKLMDYSNTHVIGNYNATIYRPNDDK